MCPYAARDMDQNQPPADSDDLTPSPHTPSVSGADALEQGFIELRAAASPETPPELVALMLRLRRGLFGWLLALVGASAFSLLLGSAEGALLCAVAGLFALAQATDAAAAAPAYRDWVHTTLPRTQLLGAMFRGLVRSILPLFGSLMLLGMAAFAYQSGPSLRHRVAAACGAVAALLVLTLAARPVANAVARKLFRTDIPTRTERLTARVTAIALLAFPALALMRPEMLETLAAQDSPLVTPQGLVVQMFGLVMLGLAGVGLYLKRDWRQSRERLGLTAMTGQHWVWAGVGLAAVAGLNSGMEWIELHQFPALALQDAKATQMIAAHLSLGATIVLGISAGVGEEITVRGALQPRLGLVLSSLLFACGHVQYTWFGVLTVGLLGVSLGLLRRRTNTTTAMVVHGLYDILAAFSAQ